MPNIEIYGFLSSAAMVAARERRVSIFDRLKNHPCIRDLVVTIVASDPKGIGDAYMPFLRIYTTDATEVKEIVRLLKPLDMDIEVLILNRFIPAQT